MSERDDILLLIVEDDPLARRALRRLLDGASSRNGGGRRPAVIREAATLAEGLTLLDGVTHIILDLDLPDGDGAALLAHVRAADPRPAVRVAVYSGTPDLVWTGEALRQGPDAFFRKPVEVPRLLAWLRDTPAAPAGDA